MAQSTGRGNVNSKLFETVFIPVWKILVDGCTGRFETVSCVPPAKEIIIEVIGCTVYGCHVCSCDSADRWDVFLSQDLENQSLTEAETWREQQLQFEEQQALHNRAKQEAEAEVERYKQVMGDVFLKWQLF